MIHCKECLENNWKFKHIDGFAIATCQQCGHEEEFFNRKKKKKPKVKVIVKKKKKVKKPKPNEFARVLEPSNRGWFDSYMKRLES